MVKQLSESTKVDIHDLLLDLSTPEKEQYVKLTGRLLGRTTSLGYLRKLAGGRAMPSLTMAQALVKAATKLRPAMALDIDSFAALRKAREESDKKRAAMRRQPPRTRRR